VILLFIVLGVVLWNWVAYRHAYAMTHFTAETARMGPPEGLKLAQKCSLLVKGVRIVRPQAEMSVEALGSCWKAVTIEGPGAVRLGACYREVAGAGCVVLLFHGYASEKTALLSEAEAFLQMGCSVLLVDFRGSGESSEAYTTIGYLEADDVLAAVEFGRRQFPQAAQILYGASMGAAAVLRAIHLGQVKPAGIILEAVFDRLLNTVRHRFEAMKVPAFPNAQLLLYWGGKQGGFDGFSHNPVDYAASVKCPALFLHGSADPRATVEEGRRVFAAVNEPKRFEEFPGLGHESALGRFPEMWKEAVGSFLGELGR